MSDRWLDVWSDSQMVRMDDPTSMGWSDDQARSGGKVRIEEGIGPVLLALT
jgi:hypothetical protein